MNEFVFPPSTNWNHPQISDCSENIYTYAARNRVVVFDILKEFPKQLKFLLQFDAHKDKVLAIRCAKTAVTEGNSVGYISTIGEEGFLRVWNIQINEVKLMYQHSCHKHKLSALAWKLLDKQEVERSFTASGDFKGAVILFSLENRNFQYRSCDNRAVTCLQFAPGCQNPHLLAAGYQGGMIVLFDTSHANLDVVCKLRSADEKIESLSWCPDLRKEELQMTWIPNLVSSSADRLLRFYHVKTSGDLTSNETRSLFYKRLPGKPGSKKPRNDSEHGSSKLFFIANWVQRANVLTSSLTGELIAWNIKFNLEKGLVNSEGSVNNDRRVFVDFKVADESSEGGHNRAIQSITANKDLVFTHGMDRYLCMWDISSMKNISIITTIGGSVFDMDVSPVSKTWLAIASGGGYLLVWNSRLASQEVDSSGNSLDSRLKMLHVWQGYKTKVTVVCFHPSKEGLVAFGTEDGKVGLYDVTNNRGASTSTTFHSSTVYALSFGPAPETVTDDTADSNETEQSEEKSTGVKTNKKYVDLYSCASDGKVFIHNPSALNEAARNLNSILETKHGKAFDEQRSAISWSHDNLHLAVGNNNGTVEILDSNLNYVAIIELHTSALYHLAWQYPDVNDAQESSVWLAVSSKNDMKINVVDISSILRQKQDKNAETGNEAPVISNVFCQLFGHKKKIGKIQWSPHERQTLLSTSNDGSVQMWKISPSGQYECAGNYLQNADASATCAKFSLSDADLVYSGGTDFIMHCWRPSKQERKAPEVFKSNVLIDIENAGLVENCSEIMPDMNGNHIANGADNEQSSLNEAKTQKESSGFENIRGTAITPKADEGAGDSKVSLARRPKLKTFLKQLGNSPKVFQAIQETRRVFESKEKAKNVTENSDNVGIEKNDGDSEDSFHGMFCGASGALGLLKSEAKLCEEASDFEGQSDVLLLQGSVEQAIDVAIAKGSLSEKHIAASFMGGFKLWRKCVEALLDQSRKNGNVNDACQYLLMLNRVHEAIKLMADNGKLKDAVVIGTFRLPAGDPYLRKLHEELATNSEKSQNFETAAQCYLTLGDYERAARLLTTRNHVEANLLALDITLVTENASADRMEYLMNICVVKLLLGFEFSRAQELIQNEKLTAFQSADILKFSIQVVKLFTAEAEKCMNIQLIENRNTESSKVFEVPAISSDEVATTIESRFDRFLLEFCGKLKKADLEKEPGSNEYSDCVIYLDRTLPQLLKLKSTADIIHVSNINAKMCKAFLVVVLEIVLIIIETRAQNEEAADVLVFPIIETILKEKFRPLIGEPNADK